MVHRDGRPCRQKESSPVSHMTHDLVLAVVFLAMIIAPALVSMRDESEESNSL